MFRWFKRLLGPFPIIEFDDSGRKIYYEAHDGYWWKRTYSRFGFSSIDSNKVWYRVVLDDAGMHLFYETDGYWRSHIYDSNGWEISFKNSKGTWRNCEFDYDGNETYYEDSYGVIRGEKK